MRTAGFAVYLGHHGGGCTGFKRGELAFKIVLKHFAGGRGAIHLRAAVRAFHFGGAGFEQQIAPATGAGKSGRAGFFRILALAARFVA